MCNSEFGSRIYCGILVFAAVASSLQAQEPASQKMKNVGLAGTPINDLALLSNGDVLAATSAGLYRANADGQSVSLMDGGGLPRAMAACVVSVVAVNSKGDIFIAVKNSEAGGNAVEGKELYRRQAGSAAWQSIGESLWVWKNEYERVRHIVIAPDDTIYVAVEQPIGDKKVFRIHRSTDRGTSWPEVRHGDEQDWYIVVALAAPNAGQLWLSGGFRDNRWLAFVPDASAATPEFRRVMIEPKQGDRFPGDTHVCNFAFDSRGAVYALAEFGRDPKFPLGVYRSTNQGAAWERLTPDGISQQLWSLAVSPDDHIYYSTHGGIRRSTDGGKSWNEFAGIGGLIPDMLFDYKGYLWAGSNSLGRANDTGLWRSVESVGRGVTPPGGGTVVVGPGTGSGTTAIGPPTGTEAAPGEPSNVKEMTLQAGIRRVREGETVMVPVWLILGKDVANMNFTVSYHPAVAVSNGPIRGGNLLGGALFEQNPAQPGLMRIGFAQSSGLNGTGTVAQIPFRAVGKPGDRTELTLDVPTINSSSGSVLAIRKIHGAILIVDKDDQVPGDCDGDGTITAADAQCALQMSVKLRSERLHMDVDRDGTVTSNDARLILDIRTGRTR